MTGKTRGIYLASSHPVAAALICGLLVWLALPSMVVAVDDDYGYLRSVVETLQRGRPWTYDALTPWAASMSVLSAILYKASGSFTFGIHFSLAVAAGLGVLGLAAMMQAHGFGRFKACFLALLIFGNPTVLFMLVMYTSVALYFGCLCLCLWLHHRQRWGWFFLVWAIALSSRQSAIVWLALPGWTAARAWWPGKPAFPRSPDFWIPALVVACGGLVLLALMRGMNPTYGQAVVAHATEGIHLNHISFRLAILALVCGYGCSGLAACFTDAAAAGRAARSLGSWKSWLLVLPACAAGFAGSQWFLNHILWTHSAYVDPFAPAWFGLLGIAGGLGLALRPVVPRWEMLFAGLGASALLGLYGGLFDYYFVDSFLWGFAAALVPVPAAPLAAGRAPLAARLGVAAPGLVFLVFAAWNARCYIKQKYEMDRVAALNVIYESAVRAGKIKPHEIGLAPFGYLGWRFEPYFHKFDGKDSQDLAGFMQCVDGWNGKQGMAVLTLPPKSIAKRKKWLPPHNNALLRDSKKAELVATMKAPMLWFFEAEFQLKRMPDPVPRDGKVAIDYTLYQDHPFPLNDAEWDRVVARQPVVE